MVRKQDLSRISDVLWEVPKEYRDDMTVPARLYASEKMLDDILNDRSVEQLVNSATLPGLVKYALAMPDIHQGYGFPIGGVVASRTSDGAISPGAIGYDINCLRGDSRILHAHGYTLSIAEMEATWPDNSLRCQNFDVGCEDTTSIVRYLKQVPRQLVYRLTTDAGDEIVATADHPFWTPDGMVELERLVPGDRVARYPFEGVPYQPPGNAVLVDEHDIRRVMDEHGKGTEGNALGQVLAHLQQRDLLPLRADSPQLPHLLKLLGYLFGDGTVYFNSSGMGIAAFYGDAADLEQIRTDVAAVGFAPSRIYTRQRHHQVSTTYDDYEFKYEETYFRVSSSAFASLLVALGAPVGAKAAQDYHLPEWLFDAPRWQQRLFLAAFFGAELSAPQAFAERNHNFYTPVLSLNKREGFVESGKQFLEDLSQLLSGFGVITGAISQRKEQINPDGTRSYRLRLILSSQPESLINLWSCIGFEFNGKRQTLALTAVEYLKCKARIVALRDEAASQAMAMQAAGVTPQAIYAELTNEHVNRRFLERSLYEGRLTGARVGTQFETFEEFRTHATAGIEGSGMVWATIEMIEPVDFPAPSADSTPGGDDGYVYDFTVAHPDHNFIADGFVVSNCGVRLLGSSVDREALGDLLADLASSLYKNCPSGVGKSGRVRLSVKELEKVLVNGAQWALRAGYARPEDLPRTEESGKLDGADPSKVSDKAKKRGKNQVGTLGAGNHFVEVDEVVATFDEAAADAMGLFPGQIVVQIHCGSRGFGHQVCTDYVRRFQKSLSKYGIQLPDRELVHAPFQSPEGQDYLAAMKCAANYAFANRQVLAHLVRRSFEEALAGKVRNWDVFQVYDIAHNMGKVEQHTTDGEAAEVCVHRKGATRAFGPGFEGLPPEYRPVGQPVLVPGSMGTSSWVLVGTQGSMEQSFGSTCHGAGRTMSRTRAKKTVWGADLRDELQGRGIEIRAGSMAGLAEEAPIAYKDVDQVVDVVSRAGIAKKVAQLRPMAVIKG
ncbi:MAG: intein-containing RctB family protein [Anaerolineae bacterium]